MGVFDNELILPGTITEITSDYSYGYDTSLFGTTDSVTIIGTAFNGPVGQAVQIYSPEHAAYIFGESYDYATRREATLVAEIINAWERGCRTIYAVRVSGKDIHKDFEVIPETKLKLRVSGLFPSNANKEIYMVYDNTDGAEAIKIYKPAKRATMQEKLEGLVDAEESILVAKIEINNSYGLTKDSRLVELIKVVNEHYYNNVIKLSIVDDNGADVTYSSKEAQALSVGSLFPGAYFIGRDKNKGVAVTDVQYKFVKDGKKPYENFDDYIYKNLVINTDVNAAYPIYGETVQALNEKLPVKMSTLFDFLEVVGKVDEVFGKNKTDYEEVEISDFDLYSRLGSGYAITAKAEVNEHGVIKKVRETPSSDVNRVVGITDGIYSMLENLTSDYRVLTCGVADSTISGKLPRKADFKVMRPKTVTMKNVIQIDSLVDPKEFVDAKKYKFAVEKIDAAVDGEKIQPLIYTEKTFKSVSIATKINEKCNLAEGTLVLVNETSTETLCRVTDGIVAPLAASKNSSMVGMLLFKGNAGYKVEASADKLIAKPAEAVALGTGIKKEPFKYVLVESVGSVYVYEIKDGALSKLAPVGSVEEVFNSNDDKTLITIQSEFGQENIITIKSTEFDYTTLEEFVEILNADKNINKLFAFKLTANGIVEKDSTVEDVFKLASSSNVFNGTTMAADKEEGVDTALYIPYKTNDNFARHLAQHCTYTSLKTAPTHGVIGCSKLMDVNLTSVAKKVDSVLDLDLTLYAKKSNGKDILDRNNMPYPIGKNVSVVVGQYLFTTLDGYSYISNSAAGYAGMVSVLALDQSSTNQPINIPTPMYELTNYQLSKLTQKGYVTFKQSYTQGIVVTDGITMAPATSPFRRLSVTRITNAIEEVIRTACEPFIGKQNHLANRNSMQTSIKSGLDKLKGKLIEGYSFKLQLDSASTKLGIVNIDYRIVPIYEIREVRNNITVGDNL